MTAAGVESFVVWRKEEFNRHPGIQIGVDSRLRSLLEMPLPTATRPCLPTQLRPPKPSSTTASSLCAIEGQPNKVFLVKDTSEAVLKALEADDLRFVLTGGQTSQCSPLALVAVVVETTLYQVMSDD
jgi:hypothetical protein